jgi:hypothetical protein
LVFVRDKIRVIVKQETKQKRNGTEQNETNKNEMKRDINENATIIIWINYKYWLRKIVLKENISTSRMNPIQNLFQFRFCFVSCFTITHKIMDVINMEYILHCLLYAYLLLIWSWYTVSMTAHLSTYAFCVLRVVSEYILVAYIPLKS